MRNSENISNVALGTVRQQLHREYIRLYIIIAVICYYLDRKNYKVLKFYMTDSSWFEKRTSLFKVSQFNKHRTLKLRI